MPLVEGKGKGRVSPCCLKCEVEAAGTTSFDVAGQDGRRKHPQRSMPFDMAKRRVRGVVTTFDEGKGGPASGLFEGR
jgi:hypothetical protein